MRIFCVWTLALTLIGLTVRFLCAHLLHLTAYPYGFYVTRVDGLDLMTFYTRFQHVHSGDFFSPQWGPAYAYPGAVSPIYWILFRVRHAQIPFVLSSVCGILAMAWWFAGALGRRGVLRWDARWFMVVVLLCSYPLYFEFARGNVEIYMWMLTSAAVYFILKERYWVGSGILGLAIAMKLYPFVLLGLLLPRRKWLPILFSVAVAVLYSLFGLWVLCPDISVAQHGVNFGLQSFQKLYAAPFRPILSGVDHSLYALIKRFLGPRPLGEYEHILRGYTLVTAVGGLVAYFMRIRKMPVINQVLCLTLATVMLPPVSFDYTLIHLYTPFALWVLLLVSLRQAGITNPKGTRVILLCFVVLFSQVGEIILQGDRLGGQIKAVALLLLFIAGLIWPLWSEFDQVGSPATGASLAAG